MVIAVNPRQSFEYVIQSERDLKPELQTVWICRCLDAREEAEVNDVLLGGLDTRDLVVRSGSVQRETLLRGLTGWVNFRDVSGADVQQPTKDRPIGELLDLIPSVVRGEIANAIARRGKLSEAEKD
jgi:hypothetical protein